MTRVWVACIVTFVFSVVPDTAAESPGHYDYGYEELYQLEEAIFRVYSEQRFLRERAAMLLQQKEEVDKLLINLDGNLTEALKGDNSEQTTQLSSLQQDIKSLRHSLGDIEADTANQNAAAVENNKLSLEYWADINDMIDTKVRQDAKLDKAENAVPKIPLEMLQVIDDHRTVTARRATEIFSAAAACQSWLNTRKCYSNAASVTVDPETATGSINVTIPPTLFSNVIHGDSLPTVLCGMAGFSNTLKISDKVYDYHYPDDLQSAAVAVDCMAQRDRVTVNVMDLSRGKGNQVNTVHVEINICSFAAQS